MIPMSSKATTIPMAIIVLLNAVLVSPSDVVIVPLLAYEDGDVRLVLESD